MAWFKFDHATLNKAQIVEIARILGLPRTQVIGALCYVWVWFSEQTVTGQSRGCPGTIGDIAGTPGLGEALVQVGWLVFDPENGGTVSMPNFDRWTGSAHEVRRKQAWRARQRHVPGLSRDCPVNVPSQTQTQTQTQKKKEPPINPPAGAGAPPPPASPAPARGGKKTSKPKPWTGTVPASWLEAPWGKWLAYRQDEKRKPVTQMSGEAALQELLALGEFRAIRAIEHSIANGWQGIFEPKPEHNGNGQHTSAALEDIEARAFRKEFGL